MLDGTQRGGARAAVVAGDDDHVRMGLRDARRDGSDAVFGDEFHGDSRGGVGGAEVVNQLREIFNGIDVVMRRR